MFQVTDGAPPQLWIGTLNPPNYAIPGNWPPALVDTSIGSWFCWLGRWFSPTWRRCRRSALALRSHEHQRRMAARSQASSGSTSRGGGSSCRRRLIPSTATVDRWCRCGFRGVMTTRDGDTIVNIFSFLPNCGHRTSRTHQCISISVGRFDWTCHEPQVSQNFPRCKCWLK